MRRLRVVVAFASLVSVAVLATAAPAFAEQGGITSSDRRISVSGDVVVARGEVVTGPVAAIDGSVLVRGAVTDYVVVGDGDLVVSGRVTRSVVVAHGNAVISGQVRGDVVALTGRVTVTRTGSVGGDVVSRRDPNISPGTVDGEVRGVDLRGIFTGVIIGFLAYLWLAVTIMVAILGLVFVGLLPRAADTAAAAGKRVGPSFGWGALVGIVGPLTALLVLATVLGLPLGLTMLSAVNVLAPIGYVAACLIFGRLFVKGRSNRARTGAFFAGFGILRLIALIPGVGLVVWFVVCVYGIGAVSMAAWYGGHEVRPDPESEPPESEPPESEPPESESEPPAPDPPAPDAQAPTTSEASTSEPPTSQTPSADAPVT